MINDKNLLSFSFTDFARRHFDPEFGGTKILTIDEDAFVEKLHWRMERGHSTQLFDGYAPFCKLVMVENFANLLTGSMEIINENFHLLKSGYKSRQEGELPILSRWFEFPANVPEAKVITIVLYSKEQIEAEEHSRGNTDFKFKKKWGIVNVMAHMDYHVEPMTPITMMRNALGKEEGGSGVPLDREEYIKASEYWNTHAVIK